MRFRLSAFRHSAPMDKRQTLPRLWLLTDQRNDAGLEAVLVRMPRGSGLVFRHYHLAEAQRSERFRRLARLARARGMVVILSGDPRTARKWGADGVYGSLRRAPGLLRLATAHSLREIAAANRAGADAVLLSPVFATRSHPGAKTLGRVRFRLLARHAAMPVIALGGMDRRSAGSLGWLRWAGIDGFSGGQARRYTA